MGADGAGPLHKAVALQHQINDLKTQAETLTQQRNTHIIRAFADGETTVNIAEATGLSRTSIGKIIRK